MAKLTPLKGAPMVEVHRDQLGDAHLDQKESLAREEEATLKLAAKHRIHGQDKLEDPDRSAGPRLHYSEIIRRITTINPHIKALDGIPGNVALYAPKKSWEIDPEGRDTSKDDFFHYYKYVGGLVKEWLPEYGHVTLDTSKLPVREVRGWRSVLLGLIKAGAITIDQANESFGFPVDNRSNFWFKQVAEFLKEKQTNG